MTTSEQYVAPGYDEYVAELEEEQGRTGAALLDDVEMFLRRFVAYPSEAAGVAHTLWIAHCWFMGFWDSTPRIAFLSPEYGSGKSRALEVTEPLVPRPIHAVNTTPAYLFRKVSDPEGAPTILYDEIDTVFGPRAKDNEDIRGMLNAGHRQGAVAGRAVKRGQTVVTEELPAYCAVALAGLNDLPDTIMSRSVVVRMRRRAPDEQIDQWRRRLNTPAGHALRDRLEKWADLNEHRLEWPDMPPGVEDRNADVWEALLAVANLAGGRWSERARVSAVSLVTASRGAGDSLGVVLLRDLREVLTGQDRLSTEAILSALHGIKESPWGDLRGKPIDARWLARTLRRYDVSPKVIRDGSTTWRGYDAADLADPWRRYLASPEPLPPAPQEHVTAVTSETGETSTACDECGTTNNVVVWKGTGPRCKEHNPLTYTKEMA